MSVPDADRRDGLLPVWGFEVQHGQHLGSWPVSVGLLDAQRQSGRGVRVDGVLHGVRPAPQLRLRPGWLRWGAAVGGGAEDGGGAGAAEHGVGDCVEEGPYGEFRCRHAYRSGAGEEAVALRGHCGSHGSRGLSQRVGDGADAPAVLAVRGQGGVHSLLGHALQAEAQGVAPSGCRGVLVLVGGEEDVQAE
ncbi:hypothetical protein GCM10027072_79910 [Streptomyces bullii]